MTRKALKRERATARRKPIRPKGTRTPKRNRGRPAKEDGTELMRDRILNAAEELFAEHGFDGVTVRQVTRRANVDVALAHYYFDTKRGLFDAVFLRRAAIINEERIKAIDEYQANPGPGGATIEGFIQAFLDPVMERWATGGKGWKDYLAIVAQVNNTPKWGGETMARYFDPVIHRLIDGLRSIMPGARDIDLYWSYQFLSGALTLTFAETGRIDRLSSGLCRSSDEAAVRSRMAPYIAAGFRCVCLAKNRKPPGGKQP
ncbi:MAG: TetR family transcriptional regulator [Alphaproteobacteria bacterium]|nr:TetR family transcriptional regulator [Alphaproteobacteria bacterium]